MTKIKELKEVTGAWEEKARDIFTPTHARVFVDENDEAIGYLWGDYHYKNRRIFYIELIVSEEKRKGYGKAMLSYLFENMDIKEIQGETPDENIAFWSKMGAEIDEEAEDEIRDEVYGFTLKKESFYGNLRGYDYNI